MDYCNDTLAGVSIGYSDTTGGYVDIGAGPFSPGGIEQQQEQQDNYYDSLNQLNDALDDANYFYDLYYQDPYERGGGSDSIRIAEAGVSDVGTNWWEFIDNDGIPGYTKMGYAVDAWNDMNYLSATSWWLSGAMEQFNCLSISYLTAKLGSLPGYLKNTTGGLYQWIRLGPSYDTVLKQETKFSIRWGASPFYADKYIGNSMLRDINQWIRKRGGGHWHIWY